MKGLIFVPIMFFGTIAVYALEFAFPVVLILVAMSGCAGAKLMKCPEKAVDPALMTCSDQVSGTYRKCEKPVDLYVCQDPQ